MKRRLHILTAIILASSLTFATLPADAAANYKTKNGKLVHTKTSKLVKGYVTYNKKLYKNGKLYSGIHNDKLYKKGKLDTKNYYVTSNTLYRNGHVVYSLVLHKGILYNSSMRAVGKIIYKDKLYVNGKIKKGIVLASNKQLYEDGLLKKGFAIYKDRIYFDGLLYGDTVVFNSHLFIEGELAEDYIVYDDKLFLDGKLAPGYVLYNPTGDPENFEAETLYYKGFVVKGEFIYEGMTYRDGKIVLP